MAQARDRAGHSHGVLRNLNRFVRTAVAAAAVSSSLQGLIRDCPGRASGMAPGESGPARRRALASLRAGGARQGERICISAVTE